MHIDMFVCMYVVYLEERMRKLSYDTRKAQMEQSNIWQKSAVFMYEISWTLSF